MMPTDVLQFEVARTTFIVLLPEILLILTATAMMTAGAFVQVPRRVWCATAAAALVVALIALAAVARQVTDPYASPVLNDAFSGFGRALFLLTGLVVLGLAHDQVDDARSAEFFGSLLLLDAGAMVVAAANELVLLFVSLELVSIPTYLLLYLPRRTTTTQEAATKYFFLSIFSSGLLLFGLAYLYGLTGVSNLKALGFLAGHVAGVPQPNLALLAVVFVVAGLGFQVVAVPFHFYAPDVYQGSPTALAALLAWVPKGVGFLALVRTVTFVVGSAVAAADVSADRLAHRAVFLAWIIAVVTMTLGNTVALAQENLKRLLAYSSIAHAGYLMIGVAVAFRQGFDPHPQTTPWYYGAEGVLFYLTAYALMTLGVFGVILLLSTPERPVETVGDLAGLGWSHPSAALALTVCLFSLAGIPPLAGFMGKFELFAGAFAASPGKDGDLFWWLAIAGVLNSAIGAYYYLRIVVGMYLGQQAGPPLRPRPTWPSVAAVTACAGLSLFFGMYPLPLINATREAAEAAISTPDPAGEPGPIATNPAQAAGPSPVANTP
jgi:NADH-quinone oxidoreductase subunit N